MNEGHFEAGHDGMTILGFGPKATAQGSEVVHDLRDQRGDTASRGSAPGEAHGDRGSTR